MREARSLYEAGEMRNCHLNMATERDTDSW